MESNPIPLNAPLPYFLEEVDGEYRLKGHRISLFNVVGAYWDGLQPYAMVFHYASLSLYEIERVIEFYHANRAAVDDYMARYQAVLDHQRATGKTYDRAELLRRYEARRAAAAGAVASANGAAAPAAEQAAPAGAP